MGNAKYRVILPMSNFVKAIVCVSPSGRCKDIRGVRQKEAVLRCLLHDFGMNNTLYSVPGRYRAKWSDFSNGDATVPTRHKRANGFGSGTVPRP